MASDSSNLVDTATALQLFSACTFLWLSVLLFIKMDDSKARL